MKKLSILPRGTVCFCLVLFISVAGCTGRQEKAKIAPQSAKESGAGTTVVATIPDDLKPPPALPGHEPDPTLPGKSDSFQVAFSDSGSSVAYLAGKDNRFFVVHNQERGKEYPEIATIVLSPDGSRLAYGAHPDGNDRKWCMVVDGKEGKRYDTVLTPIFSPDGKHLLYQAKDADKWYIIVDGAPNQGTPASYSPPLFSSDSSSIAYVESAASIGDTRLIVTDLLFHKQRGRISIGDEVLVINKNRTRIAAVEAVKNKFRVIDLMFDKPDLFREGPLYDVIEQLTLSDDGRSISYCALKGGSRLIKLDDREELLPAGRAPELPVIRPDKKGVGILLAENNRISLHHCFINGREKGKIYDEASTLTYGNDGSYAYAARTGKNWFVVVNGNEGPAFDKVVEPLFSPDGKHVAYRARKDGKRFVVLADTLAKTVAAHPPYEQVSRVKFTADGKSIAYGVKDGNRLAWKVAPL